MHRYKAKAVLLLLAGALVLGLLTLAWAIGPRSSEAQQGAMHNCPQPNKWAISVWNGDNGTDTGEALATCGTGAVAVAYSIDPDTQGWSRWFAGRPEMTTLPTLDNMQGVIALGAVGAPAPTPTPAATPAPTPTATPTPGAAGDVILVSSNAFTATSSILIDGESRRMHVVGELRNESSTPRRAGKLGITIYDAVGNVVGLRRGYAFDDIIQPGRTTAFREAYPSIMYWSDETNDFPEGWTRYEITLSPRNPSGVGGSPVDIAVENVQITDGGRHVSGNAVNLSSKTVDKYGVEVYVIYYRADGTILNAKQDPSVSSEPLAPGQSVPFDISFLSDEPVDFSSYLVQAYAEAE